MSNLISRKEIIRAVDSLGEDYISYYKLLMLIYQLPSAEPEHEEFEWCHDCKEYDQEKHCCPRWNKVIKKTVEDMKSNQWIPVTEALPKNYEQTICIDSRGKMMIGTYGEYGWTFPCYMTEPIAWMSLPEPLPEPWKGE